MMVVLLFVIVLVAAAMLFMALRPASTTPAELKRRLTTAAEGPQTGSAPSLVNDFSQSPWARLVAAVEARGLSLRDTEGEALAERLMLAGYTQPFAVRAFVLIKMGLVIGLPLLAYLFLLIVGLPSPAKLYMVIAAAATIGMYLPNFVVSSKAGERKKEILNGFPDALDLMLVCVDAGLGIDASFARVGAEITVSHPLLAELLAMVSLELRAGRTREVALRNLARRTGLAELVAFVTLLNQSAKLGSSVSQALRVYASEMREARRMRAEEKAARLPVLLSVPLVVFLLPTMVAVLMLPAGLTVRNTMAHMHDSQK
ncbi:MAG: type II secretion system F family protein [Sphingomonadaceae bacterium]|nr:type II secretion system F family protein [Sphingomonadaceae bacterium]